MKGPRWRLLLKIFVTSALPLYFPVDWFMYFSPIVRPITVVCLLCYCSNCSVFHGSDGTYENSLHIVLA